MSWGKGGRLGGAAVRCAVRLDDSNHARRVSTGVRGAHTAAGDERCRFGLDAELAQFTRGVDPGAAWNRILPESAGAAA